MSIPAKMSIGSTIVILFLSVFGSMGCGLWLAGIVLAQGFWSTIFSFFPPYAWYLVVERLMQTLGVMP